MTRPVRVIHWIMVSWVLAGHPSPLLAVQASAAGPAADTVRIGNLTSEIAFRTGPPAFRVGWGPSDYAFSRITGGVILDDGRVVVGDDGTSEIVYIDEDGTLGAVVGAPGEGPGEFSNIASVTRRAGDTVLVEDDVNLRFTTILDGEVSTTERMSTVGLGFQYVALGWENGDLILGPYSLIPEGGDPWISGAVVRHRPGLRGLDTLTLFDFGRRPPPGPRDPLRPAGEVGLTAGALLIVRHDRAQVRVHHLSDDHTTVIEWSEPPRRLTDSLWQSYVEYSESRGLREEFYGLEARAGVREPLNPVGRPVGDVAGRVWVSEFSPDRRHPTRFRVFSREGNWLGWVEVPARTQILDISENAILAIQRDEFDVEAVVLLPLEPIR